MKNDSSFPEITHISVSIGGVIILLHNLNLHNASGPDEIPACFSYRIFKRNCTILTLIFQSSMHQESIPDKWKTAKIISVFKKDDRMQTCNYRSVSLTSICSQLLEHIIMSVMWIHLHSLYLKENNILRKE